MRADWTDDDIALLRKLWAAGETAATIAKRLGGMSRSAVLGKIFRLRLAPQSARQGPSPQTPQTAREAASIARRRGGAQPQPPAPAAKTSAGPKTVFELTNECCRWPFRRPGAERYFFCGAPEADLERGIPYCRRHMQRAYLVPPRVGDRAARKMFRAIYGGDKR